MLIADTHVHIYPSYDLGMAVSALSENLAEINASATPVAILAERHDCHFFRKAADGKLPEPYSDVVTAFDGSSILFSVDEKTSLFMFPGRQIVTAERLEILCLLADADIEDGLPASEVIELSLQAGGIPVLSWAVGKWLFGRSRVVKNLLQQYQPDKLLLGDTAMRPVFWGEPVLMKRAAEIGFRIVAGTDPLPFNGQEKIIGKYASLIDADIDAENPAFGLRAALLTPGVTIRSVGRRSGPVEFFRRIRG